MPRIFASLAIATLILFVLTAAVALFDSGSVPDRHVLLAVGTLLMSCLIQVVGFTYLTVTGKVVAQAVHLANLDPACVGSVKQYKQSFTRHLALVVIGIVVASATGGAAWRSRDALAFHIPAAMIASIAHFWVYWGQYHIVRRNADLLESTLKAYSSWRIGRIDARNSQAANAESHPIAP